MKMLKKLFVSEVRLKILELMLLNPEESLHVREIVRRVGAEINAVRRELENLTTIGMFTKRKSSNRLYYTVVTEHTFYAELLSLLSKERGIGSKIVEHAEDIGNPDFAVLSLGFLRGRKSTSLDVDLFLVGDSVNTEALSKILGEYEKDHGKEVNYSIMTVEEFRHRKRTNDQFTMRMMSQSRSMLIGDSEKFYAVV
jgi:hypothetical protein